MAISAGSVSVRLGAEFKDKDAFDRYDKAIEKARREKNVETALKGDFDKRAFAQYERALNESQQKAKRRSAFKATLGADYNARAFRQYEKALDESRRDSRRGIKARLFGDFDRRGFSQFDRASKGAERDARRIGVAGRVGAGGLSVLGRGAGLAAGALGAVGLGGAIAFMARETADAQVANAKLTGVLRSMGAAAPATRKQIEGLTNSISRQTGEDDEAVKSALTVLATFKQLGGEQQERNRIFERGGKILKGLSLVMGGDMNRAAIMVGKALAEPATRAGALARVGAITRAEMEHLKEAAENGEPAWKQQAFLMRALERQTGKVSAEYGKSLPAALGRARVGIGDLAERYGNKLAPSVDRGLRAVTKFTKEIETGRGKGGRFRRTVEQIADGFGDIVRPVARVVSALARFAARHPAILKVAGGIAAVGVAMRALRFARAVSGINEVVRGFRRIANTRAGQRAGAAITRGLRNLWGRLRGSVGNAASRLAGAFGRGGDRAADAAVDGIVGGGKGKGKGVGDRVDDSARKGRLATQFKNSGKLLGRGLIIGIILALPALIPDLSKAIRDLFDKVPGLSDLFHLGEKAGHGIGEILGTNREESRAAPIARGVPEFFRGPGRQHGGTVLPGEHMTLVGEAGPELASFPAGTQITPAPETRRRLSPTSRRATTSLAATTDIAGGLEDDRKRSASPLRKIKEDLDTLAKNARAVGQRAAKGVADPLNTARNSVKKTTERMRKQVVDELGDMRKGSDKEVKRIQTKVLEDRFDDARKAVRGSVTRMRRDVDDRFGDMRKSADRDARGLSRSVDRSFDSARKSVGDNTRRMQRATDSRLGAMVKTARSRGSQVAGSMRRSMGSTSTAVWRGMSYIDTATDKGLKALGAKPVSLTVEKPKGFARGGLTQFGRPGEKGVDSIATVIGGEAALVAPGEVAAVFTNEQQREMDARTADVGGLEGFFRRFNRPQFMSRGGLVRRFERGGLTGPLGTGAGFAPILRVAQKRWGLQATSGMRAGDAGSDHSWGGALDMSDGSEPTPGMDAAHRFFARTLGRGIRAVPGSVSGHAIKQMLYRTNIGGNHFNHIHLALLDKYAFDPELTSALLGGAGGWKKLKHLAVRGPDGALKTMAQRVLNKAVDAANRYGRKKESELDVAGTSFGDVRGSGVPLMKRISKRKGWNFGDWWELDRRETGHGTNLTNPTSSARLRGQFLSMNYGKYGPGSDPAQNPSMREQIISMARYIEERYGNPTAARRFHDSHNWYRRGGIIRRFARGGPLRGLASAFGKGSGGLPNFGMVGVPGFGISPSETPRGWARSPMSVQFGSPLPDPIAGFKGPHILGKTIPGARKGTAEKGGTAGTVRAYEGAFGRHLGRWRRKHYDHLEGDIEEMGNELESRGQIYEQTEENVVLTPGERGYDAAYKAAVGRGEVETYETTEVDPRTGKSRKVRRPIPGWPIFDRTAWARRRYELTQMLRLRGLIVARMMRRFQAMAYLARAWDNHRKSLNAYIGTYRRWARGARIGRGRIRSVVGALRRATRTATTRRDTWASEARTFRGELRSAGVEFLGARSELAEFLHPESEDQQEAAEARTAAFEGIQVDAGDTGGATGEAAATPAQIAAQAAEQLRSFNANRASLFGEFGRKFVPQGQTLFGDDTQRAAGMRFVGAGNTDLGGVMLASGGGARTGVQGQQVMAGGRLVSVGSIQNYYPTPPPDPHTWSQGIAHELAAL